MATRHRNAIAIQLGACNPSGIALSIVEACQEIRAEPDHRGTAQLQQDSAIRLMVHQLAFICGVPTCESYESWLAWTNECEVKAESG